MAKNNRRCTPAIEKILRRCAEDANGCWLWQGAVRRDGYFQMVEVDGSQPLGHRVVYQHFRGEIPDGLVLDHLCRVRNCVNPWHLEPVTQWVNVHRGDSPWALNARKTHCKRNHEFTPENTYTQRSGQRTCRRCQREYMQRRRARQRAAAA